MYQVCILQALKERLRRKQRMNRSANVVAATVALQSNLNRESPDSNSMVEEYVTVLLKLIHIFSHNVGQVEKGVVIGGDRV